MKGHKADNKGKYKEEGARARKTLMIAAVFAAVLVVSAMFVLLPGEEKEEENEQPLGAQFSYTDPQTGVQLYYETTSESPKEARAIRYYSGIDANGHLEIPSTAEYNGSTYTVTATYDLFNGNTIARNSLKAVTLPDTVTRVDTLSFNSCTYLKTINLENVTYVGKSAFDFCSSLVDIDTSNITYLDGGAFVRCPSLKTLDLSSATYIGQNAVNACSELTSVILSSNLKEIATGAFWLSDKLTALALPYSLAQSGKIGASAIPTTTKIVYFEGAFAASAVMNGAAMDLKLIPEGSVASISVGTSHGSSNTAVLTSAPWSFLAPLKTYYVKATLTDPYYTEPELEPITYDPNGKLSDIELPAGWAWTDPGKRPTADVTSYLASYTPSDPIYASVTKPIALTVNPILYPIPDANVKEFDYNGTLKTLIFTDFVTAAMYADGHEKTYPGNYTAVIRLIDDVNYGWQTGVQEVTISWIINPGAGKDAPEYEEPSVGSMEYDPTRTLSQLTLPPGWAWIDPGICPTVNGAGYLAKFTPEDGNYTTFSKMIEFTVTPIVYAKPTAAANEFTYSGSPFTLIFVNFIDDTMYADGYEKTNAGSYTAVIRLIDNVNYKWLGGGDEVLITWTILQADGKDAPEYEEPSVGTMEYDPARKLSDLPLPLGWTWIGPGTCPTVKGTGYLAKFTPTDSNYTIIIKMIEFTVTPVTYPETDAVMKEFVYNGSLKTLELIGFDGTTMVAKNISATVVGNYTAVIRLIDTENYRWDSDALEVSIPWFITGGDGIDYPSYTDPSFDEMVYSPTRTLDDLELPYGWKWYDKTICPTVNVTGYLATFTPDDENYKTVTKMIPLSITPVVYEIPDADEKEFVYSGSQITLAFSNYNAGTMYANGYSKKDAGSYTAVIRLIDNENYKWKNGNDEIVIEWSIAPADGTKAPGYEEPSVGTMVYSPTRTLNDLELPEGWEWISPGICPSVNGIGYLAKFTPADPNYTTFSMIVEFTVTPIVCEMPEAVSVEFVYNGLPKTLSFTNFNELTMTVSGHTKTDSGSYTAVIRLMDVENYKWKDGSDEIIIEWAIAMGDGTSAPDYREPSIGGMTYDPERTLNDLELPKGWVWISPGICPTVNGTGYLAKFTPADGNYTTFSKIIEFTVTPSPVAVPKAERTLFVYDSSTVTLKLIGLDLALMTVAGDSATTVGHYTAVIRLIDTVNYKWIVPADANIEWFITAGDGAKAPDYEEPKFPSMVYSSMGTLDDLELPTGWSWVDASITPTVDVKGYWATFTPADGNYNAVTKMIMITVTPYLYDAPEAEKDEFVYDGNEVTLNIIGFDSVTMNVIGGTGKNVGTYTAVITLIDNVNYGWKAGGTEATVEWSVVPGDGADAPDYTEPSFPKMTYSPARTLNDLVLLPGWEWHDVTIRPTVDVTGYWATFTPADSNYNAVTKQIELTVEKLQLGIPTADKTSFVYNGSLITLPLTGFDGTTMSVDGHKRTYVGNYTAIITLIDPVNYGWMPDEEITNVTIDWSIASGSGIDIPGYTEPTIAPMVYDPARTLADVPLGISGWAWRDTSITPTVNGNGYLAIFTPEDMNYAQVEVLIHVPVTPLPVPVPTCLQTTFKYDAEEKTLKFSGSDDALMTVDGNVRTTVGNYTAVIRLIDNVNYKWISDVPVVTVEWSITSGDAKEMLGYEEPVIPSMIYDPARTLADVTLGIYGWQWKDTSITPTVDGTGYLAMFVPDDENYAPIEIMIPVPVTQKHVAVPEALATVFGYNGSEWTLAFNADFDGTIMNVTGHKHTAAGDYTAIVTLKDTVNYVWGTGVQEVVIDWTVEKSDGHNKPGYEEPVISPMVYDPGRKLSGVPLGIEGWAWKDPTITPTVNGTGYLAVFTPSDPGYSQVEILIPVPVTPLPVTMPTAPNTSFKYNVAERTLGLSGFDAAIMDIAGNVHKNVGNYTVMITLKDSENYEWISENPISEVIIEWSITSGDAKDMPGYTEPTIASMVYSPTRTLASVPLGIAGWAWNDITIIPTVDGTGYLATFTPDDSGYAPIEILISVPVTPLPVTAPTAPNTSFKYNAAERTLSIGGFDDTIMDVVGNKNTIVGNYTAVVTLKDTVNYVWSDGATEVKFTWSITKGDAKDIPGYTEPTVAPMVYDPGRTLASVTLGVPGWKWNDAATIPTVNGTGYWATFVPEDSNYATVEKLIAVTVTPLLLDAPTADVTSFVHTGNEITLQLNGFDATIMNVAGNAYTSVGNYTAVVTLKDNVNYGWASGGSDVRIAWEITAAEVPMYTISVTSNGGGMFEYRLNTTGPFLPLTGPIIVAAGTFVEIRAVADDGYGFAWNDGRASGGLITFTVTGDEDLSGKFSPAPVGEGIPIVGLVLAAIVLLLLLAAVFILLARKKGKNEVTKE